MNELPNVGSDARVAVRYVGTKDVKYDNVCRSQTVWHGTGDVQLVPIEVAAKLARFPAVWELARSPGSPEVPVPTAGLQAIRIEGDARFAGRVPELEVSALDSIAPDAGVPVSGRPVLKLPAGKRGRS